MEKIWSSEESFGTPDGAIRYLTAKYINEVKKVRLI